MSILTFAERFKDKSSTITPTGIISVSPGRNIIKPAAYQLHISPPRSSDLLSPDLKSSPPQSSFFYRQSTQNITLPQIHSESHSIKPYFSYLDPDSPKLNSLKTEVKIKFSGSSKKSEALRNNSCEKKEFKPYSIGDYLKLKPNNYFKLGGLGANIGNEEWIKKKVVNDRRGTYARSVNKGVKLSREGYGIKIKAANRLNWRIGRDD